MDDTNEPLKILSIDAWRDEDGWTWNDYYKVGEISHEDFAKLNTTRKLLNYMRRKGYLGSGSIGKVSVDEPGCYADVFTEIQARGTREPLFAISAIH